MKKIVVLTGAGMSAESGMSTFRDSGGLWDRYPVEDVATPEGYARNPKLVTDFYNERRKQLNEVQPCRGHLLVAALEREYQVVVITQNVDNLHERAGSTHVIHLHGELTKVTSSRDPNNPKYIQTLPADHWQVSHTDKAADGSALRPFIVWFGEPVSMIEPAIEEVSQADVLVVIGTSLNVYPAAGLLNYASPQVPIYLIDPKPVATNCLHEVKHIMKGASEGMAELMDMLHRPDGHC